MTQDASLAMAREAEKVAAKRREKKEREIQRRLLELIKKYNLEMKRSDEEVKILWQKEQDLISREKIFRSKIAGWQRKRKQIKLEDLKRIIPSINIQ